MIQYLLQIETIGPEGGKIIWIILSILLGIGSYFVFKNKFKSLNRIQFKGFTFSRGIKISVTKNRIYHPTTIQLKLVNNDKKSHTIQNPILRFRRGRKTKAFKIKAVNLSSVYPLYLESKQTHSLPVSLQSFYDYDKGLKRYSRLRIEIAYDNDQLIKSRYLLLKSTFFRKAKR